MKKFIGAVLISCSVSTAGQVDIFIDSSGSISSIGADYVLSKTEELQKLIRKKGIASVKLYSFDDNIKPLVSLDGYFINENGNTDFKGIASKIQESPADVDTVVIVSDGKVPNSFTQAYKDGTVKSFKDIRSKGVKVCFLSLFRDVLPFPKQIADVVGTANNVNRFIDECFPETKEKQENMKNIASTGTDSNSKSNTSEIDPMAFAKDVIEMEGKQKVKDGKVIINIINK